MKKLIAILLLVCLLPLCAGAEMDENGGVTVALDGVEVFFMPAEGSICLTRESSASVFNRLGLSQRVEVPWMEQNNIYALMYNLQTETEIQVMISRSLTADFDNLSPEEQLELCAGIESYYTDLGYVVEAVEMYHAQEGHSYVLSSLAFMMEDGSQGHLVEYYTCHAGYEVLVEVYPFEGAPTAAQMALGAALADSLRVQRMERAPVTIPRPEGVLTFSPLVDGICLTRESDASMFDYAEASLGTSQQELVEWMEENNLYAVMFDGAWGCEVQIDVSVSSLLDYNTLTPEQDVSMLDEFVSFNEQCDIDVQEYGMYSNGHHRFGWLVGTETSEEGGLQYRIHYTTGYRDYLIEMVMFVYEPEQLEYYSAMARSLVDSMQYTLREDLVRFACLNARLQCALPDSISLYSTAEEAGITLPEAPYAEMVGVADAGECFLVWQMDERVSSDIDRLTDAGVRVLYETRAENKQAAGCTVTLTEDYQDSDQRYIRISYQFNGVDGNLWYAEEYYTKQDSWGASVTAYSRQPLTDEMLATLESIVQSQILIVR